MKAPFNATVQRTETIAGDPTVAAMVIRVSPANYSYAQRMTISAYGDVEVQLSDKDGTVGRVRLGVLNDAIRDAVIRFPAALASKYDSADTLRDNAAWLADLSTAILAAQAEIADLLTPEAVPAA